ncbi:hypothetical protein COY07_02345 [Candidatus Peregrinibacteria bacterium CG_4_10_14_0_2_um_filter_43_11]|nr:MAG: hypothetical protein COY07_02345 [Candidatus Peregrinibacteria bacterium CG_4_10_14_0_2_um_filter_43_11]
MTAKKLFHIRKIRQSKKSVRISKTQWIPARWQMILKYTGLAIATILLTVLVYYKNQTGDWFKASVLEIPESFDGTVLPIEKIPDWSNWSGDHYTAVYNEIAPQDLISLPPYDLSVLEFPDDQLQWGNHAQDLIRNTKITYPVVYLGDYNGSRYENSGSHLAVDIRVPSGTPVHAIANGKVIKTSMQSDGFGHHIVIKHIDVPDSDNPGKTTTIYSSYNHLGDINVVEGQNVLKGDLIGTSGSTGTASSPHLHFQIDRDSAPWHPYWPFTWQESQDAGLSFFEAINAGLGIGKAKEMTLNPMTFSLKYLGTNTILSSSAIAANTVGAVQTNESDKESEIITITEVTKPEETPTTIVEPNTVEIIEPIQNDKVDTSLLIFKLSGETVSLINNGVRIIVTDEQNQLNTLGENDIIKVQVSGVGNSLQPLLKKSDFKNGTADVVVKSGTAGIGNVLIGRAAHQITFIEKVANTTALKFEHDGHFQKGMVEVIKLIAVDSEGNPTSSVNFSGEVAITATEGKATITPNRLNARDFINGIATFRIKSLGENTRIRLRAQNGALVGESDPLTQEDSRPFNDIKLGHPNYEAIKYLKEEGVINGYQDGSFQPAKTVNRVEALKMLMLAFNVESGVNGSLPFSDTENNAWYAGTLATAIQKEIVKGYPDGTFKPAQTVNRAEYLKILFETTSMKLSASIVSAPYLDVPKYSWFSPYAYMANQKNIIDTNGNKLYPNNGMTRAEVAETIFRMKMIQMNNMVVYQK